MGRPLSIPRSLLRGRLLAVYRSWYCNSDSRREMSLPMSSKVFIPNSAISALMKRELRRYVSIPVYITNTSCGFLFAAVYIILIGIANEKAVPYIDMFSDYFQIAPVAEDILYVYALTILISLSSITYASISIEGKQIEVLKSFCQRTRFIQSEDTISFIFIYPAYFELEYCHDPIFISAFKVLFQYADIS